MGSEGRQERRESGQQDPGRHAQGQVLGCGHKRPSFLSPSDPCNLGLSLQVPRLGQWNQTAQALVTWLCSPVRAWSRERRLLHWPSEWTPEVCEQLPSALSGQKCLLPVQSTVWVTAVPHPSTYPPTIVPLSVVLEQIVILTGQKKKQ